MEDRITVKKAKFGKGRVQNFCYGTLRNKSNRHV